MVNRSVAILLLVSLAALLRINSPVQAALHVTTRMTLPDGRKAVVFADGRAEIYSKDGRHVDFRRVWSGSKLVDAVRNPAMPSGKELELALMRPRHELTYWANQLVVVFREGYAPARDTFSISGGELVALRRQKHPALALIPTYTNDGVTNRLLAEIGTLRLRRLYARLSRSRLESMRSQAEMRVHHPILDIANAYKLTITNASVRDAAMRLSKLPGIAYASPDWRVGDAHTAPVPISPAEKSAAARKAQHMNWVRPMRNSAGTFNPAYVPGNYALSSSLQSLLNAPSTDAAAVFDEMRTAFHQLPGTGEIVTNVSIGDLDDQSATANTNDPCWLYVSAFGPTTQVVAGQRFINWPSMPLIPAYTASDDGSLNGHGEVCNVDPTLGEVGLDFSMMASLPDENERPGEQGSAMTDLLGIAPGATYRLVVPGSNTPTTTDIAGAILGAALQSPRPDVITASLEIPFDQDGFSGRFLEDDPLVQAVIASVVNSYQIVVCVAANDGIRDATDTAIGPSGGSVSTDVAPNGGKTTSLSDVGFSGYPSEDYDSGSIDVGGVTLDDIFSNPPLYAPSGIVQAQHAYPETRYSGFALFSSGNGSRVDVSAPSDNVVALQHDVNGGFDSVDSVITGGTSASAPETAAAAAVVMQLARLTGHPFSDATAVRQFLEETGTPVPRNGQADAALNVGPQIDLRRAVETLLGRNHMAGRPSIARVAIEQRRDDGGFDGTFVGDTDPSNIDIGSNFGAYLDDWITIAPDWEWIPARARYRLFVAGHPRALLATTPWARMLPAQILSRAGLPLASTSARTVHLTYEASIGLRMLAQTTLSLTFSPTAGTTIAPPAPAVPLINDGSTIPVRYDLTNVQNVANPKLVVSYPGRFDPAAFGTFNIVYSQPLSSLSGTVEVPVKLLQGGGIYGIGIEYNSYTLFSTDFAYVRVAPPKASAARPLPPTLSIPYASTAGGHFLEIPYGTSFSVSWNVSNVPNANGAIVEISAPGPTLNGVYNPFNNPEGSILDSNGIDTGSAYSVAVPGASGTTTIDSKAAHLSATFQNAVRVIPLTGGVPAGEASDVSAIAEDGLVALDGGFVYPGLFGLNANGNDGFLASWNFAGENSLLTSIDTFDQTTMTANATVASQMTASQLYRAFSSAVFGSDIGLYYDFDQDANTINFGLLDPISSATIGPNWSLPGSFPGNLNVLESAWNQTNATGVFLAEQPGFFRSPPAWDLFTSDLSSQTFGTLYNISSAISFESLPQYDGIAENPNTNQAWLSSLDGFSFCGTPSLVDVDLATGSSTAHTGVGSGTPESIAVDPVTNIGAVTTGCDGGLGIYNLAAGTGRNVILPGAGAGYFVTADSIHHLFLVAQLSPPDVLTNANALSHLLVYDESGNLIENEGGFNWEFLGVFPNTDGVQINPSTRTGVTFGSDQMQLEPFTY